MLGYTCLIGNFPIYKPIANSSMHVAIPDVRFSSAGRKNNLHGHIGSDGTSDWVTGRLALMATCLDYSIAGIQEIWNMARFKQSVCCCPWSFAVFLSQKNCYIHSWKILKKVDIFTHIRDYWNNKMRNLCVLQDGWIFILDNETI